MSGDGDRDRDAAFARFVTARRPALLGTALLLAGDRGRAEELVQRALTRARRSRSGDPGRVALQALVAGATSRWSRVTRGEQVIESLPDPFAVPPPPVPGQPDLAAALRDLPPRTRAVVVLRAHEQLPDARVAELLRCPEATVGAEVARGLELLRPALAPSAFERAPERVPEQERLHRELARLAAVPGPWRLDPTQAVTDVRARRRSTRRRVATGVAAALCVVGVAVPLARWAPDPPAGTSATSSAGAASSTVHPAPSSAAPPSVPVLVGPARGSLAGDPAFLDAVRSVGWGALEPPPPAERDVVFAGDTPDGRVVLVVGTVLEDFRGVWLTGPVGAAPAQLVPQLPAQLGRDRPVTLLVGGPGPATLVVVAARGDDVQVSDRLMTGPRGTVGRTYTTVGTEDGVAVVPARTTTAGPSISVRVSRAGHQVYRSAVDWPGSRQGDPTPLPVLVARRPGAGTPDPTVLDPALTDLAVALGAEPAALQPELLWSGPLPRSRGPGTVAVVVAHSPGGALVVTTWAGGPGAAVSCGTQTPPGTTDVATLTVARVCDLAPPGSDGDQAGAVLVVTAPPAAASAQLLDADGAVLGPLALQDGSAVVGLPEGARTVRTLDAAGQVLREVPVAPAPTVPFGDFGEGPER